MNTESRWATLDLNESVNTPLYLQLARKLTDAIKAGRWQADEALPSERTLCQALSISHVTAQSVRYFIQSGADQPPARLWYFHYPPVRAIAVSS